MKTFPLVASLLFSPVALAGPIIFSDIAGIEQLEWLELTATQALTRNEVDALILGGELSGWRYATRVEVETLYSSLWGGTVSGWSEDNFPGALRFFDSFGYPYESEFMTYAWYGLFGYANECGSFSGYSCLGTIGLDLGDAESGYGLGYFLDVGGLGYGTSDTNVNLVYSNTMANEFVGSHLVRSVRETGFVPEPATIWLMGTGLIAWLGLRRRNQVNS